MLHDCRNTDCVTQIDILCACLMPVVYRNRVEVIGFLTKTLMTCASVFLVNLQHMALCQIICSAGLVYLYLVWVSFCGLRPPNKVSLFVIILALLHTNQPTLSAYQQIKTINNFGKAPSRRGHSTRAWHVCECIIHVTAWQ